jgi:hypothetical protein
MKEAIKNFSVTLAQKVWHNLKLPVGAPAARCRAQHLHVRGILILGIYSIKQRATKIKLNLTQCLKVLVER